LSQYTESQLPRRLINASHGRMAPCQLDMQLTRAPAPETWGWLSAPEGPRMRASGDGGRRPFRANPSAAGPWASRWHGVVIPDLCPEHSGRHQREPGSLGRKRLHHEAKQGALRPASACYSRTIVFELQVMFQVCSSHEEAISCKKEKKNTASTLNRHAEQRVVEVALSMHQAHMYGMLLTETFCNTQQTNLAVTGSTDEASTVCL